MNGRIDRVIILAVLYTLAAFGLCCASDAIPPEYRGGWRQAGEAVPISGTSWDLHPRWCGKTCLLVKEWSSGTSLVDTTTGKKTQAPDPPLSVYSRSCSFDGTGIFYNAFNWMEVAWPVGLWEFDVTTGKMRNAGKISDALGNGPEITPSPTEKTLAVVSLEKKDHLHSKKYNLPGWRVLYFPRDGRKRDDDVGAVWASDGSYLMLGFRDGSQDRVVTDYETRQRELQRGKGRTWTEFYDNRGRLIKSLARSTRNRFVTTPVARPEGVYWFRDDGVMMRLNARAGFAEEKVCMPSPPMPKRGYYGFDISPQGEIAYEEGNRILMASGTGSLATLIVIANHASFPLFSPTGEYLAYISYDNQQHLWNLIVLKRDLKGRQ